MSAQQETTALEATFRSARSRQRTYAEAAGTGEKYQPGFPMNVFRSAKTLYVIGIGGIILLVGSTLLFATNPGTSTVSFDDEGTPTVTTEPTVTPTPDRTLPLR